MEKNDSDKTLSQKNLSKITSFNYKSKKNSFRNMKKDVSFSMYADKTSPSTGRRLDIQGIYNTSPSIPIHTPLSEDDNKSDSSEDFDESLDRMMMAETPPDPFIRIQSRTRLKWVNDNSSPGCNQCGEIFTIFVRRHHCILEGTPVTLSNGMACKIETVISGTKIPSWNQHNITVHDGFVNNKMNQGLRSCMRMVLEDGRELVATPDHEILSFAPGDTEPVYRSMETLTSKHWIVCSTLEGVLDDPTEDTENYIIPGTELSILTARDKCLIFARICGYSLTDGSIDRKSNRIVFIMGDSDDVEGMCLDLETLLDMDSPLKRPTLQFTGKANIYRIELRSRTLKTWLENAGVTVGNKVDQGVRIPHFMWDDTCPKSIKREFIAGWFGGDGSRFGTTHNKRNLKMNDHLVSVSLQGDDACTILRDSKLTVEKMNEVIRSFGVESYTVLKGAKATIPKLSTINSNSPQQLRVTEEDDKFRVTYDTTTMVLKMLSDSNGGLTRDEIYLKLEEELLKTADDISKFKSALTNTLSKCKLIYFSDKQCCCYQGKLVTKTVKKRYFISDEGKERLKFVENKVTAANDDQIKEVCPRITSRIGFRFSVDNAVIFTKNIGFRYCIQKQIKMTIGSSYENYRKRLAEQRRILINYALDIFLSEHPDYKDPRLENESFLQKTPSISMYKNALIEAMKYGVKRRFDPSIIIGPTYKGFYKVIAGIRRTYDARSGSLLASSPTLTFKQFLSNIALDWDKPSRDGQRYFYLRVVEPPTLYKGGEKLQVYDLSVPNYVSFVANGMVVHNCRADGNIYCGTCSNNWNTIPDCITQIPTATGIKTEINRKEMVRLCDKCNEKINLVKKLEILLKSVQLVEMDIFSFKRMGEDESDLEELTDSFIKRVNDIPDMGEMNEIDVIEYAKTSMNGKLWKQLANFYLSKIREIQYKLPYQKYSEWEKSATWANYKHFKGHDIWMVHTIRSHIDDPDKLAEIVNYYFTDNEGPAIKDKDECWNRMCTRLCQPKLSWSSSLLLLDCINKDRGTEKDPDIVRQTITKNIVTAFNVCDNDIFESILPYIMDKVIHSDYNELLITYLLSRCVTSVRISNCVYWSLMIEKNQRCEYLISRLFRETPSEIYEVIMGVNNFVRSIEDNFVGDPNNPIRGIENIKECISPTHPETGKQKVNPNLLPPEESATRPIPISLTPSGNDGNTILYKREDLRTDLVVMSIMRIMQKILEEAMKIDLHVVTYNIQPVSSSSGFIGAVDKSHTLYTIEEKFMLTLANYIRKNNPEIPAKELTERFLRSCAFYSVMTFLLGIGDRHLDNIMLTERGEIFHIDYGFVLGKDPKPMNTPSMRITEGMLDAIGGYHSESYEEFKDLCYKIYDISRRHVNTFVCLLSLLPKQNSGKSRTNPKITDRRLLREIVKRFAPGETYQQAKTLLNTKIDKSTNVTSISKYHVIDFFHRHNKEGTVRNVLSYTLNTTLSGTKTVIQGIWDYLSK